MSWCKPINFVGTVLVVAQIISELATSSSMLVPPHFKARSIGSFAPTTRYYSSLSPVDLSIIVVPNRQRGIMFDQLYGWEYTLLEPNQFWKCVPDAVKPIYHFFNVPITSDVSDPHSPLRHILSIAREEDFVSFKLDIDTSSVEIPLVLQLVASSELMRLMDEFFFELHFRCEIMKYCGWGDKMPESVDWLKLDRVNTLSLFADMRRKGVRAHIWP